MTNRNGIQPRSGCRSVPLAGVSRRTAYAQPTNSPSASATNNPAGSKFWSSRTYSKNQSRSTGSNRMLSFQPATIRSTSVDRKGR
nr:hypothetical protein [Fodinicola feengrottensis]